MESPDDPDRTQAFVGVARSRLLLTEQAAEELAREAAARGVSASELALRRGDLDRVQVSMVEALLHPADAYPGYEILDVLGQGGMGVVYKARQKALNRSVALKTVMLGAGPPSGLITRFEKEAMTVASLRHPNIVTAYDFGRQGDRVYLVMELLEGEDLDQYLQRRGRLPEGEAWALARQAAWGLAHAAEHGIVHRDVKPGNMFLVPPPPGFALPAGVPMVKITDFGLVLHTAEVSEPRLTMAGMSLGTPTYMAPEQFADPAVDSRADIYALGATVYHMLAGRPPFEAATVWEIMSRKAKGEIPDVEAVASPASARLIREMLAADAARRVGTYEELLRRIDDVSAPPSAAGPTVTVSRAGAVRRRQAAWVRWLIPSVATLAFGSLLLLNYRPWSPTGPQAPGFVAGRWEPLFDGVSLRGWQITSGSWAAARDAEGGRVLAGNGTIARPLPSTPNYRLSVNIDLHQAASARLVFEAGEQAGRIYSLVLRPDEAALEWQDGNHGIPVRAASTPLPPKQGEDAVPYRELRVDRRGGRWYAFVDGKPVGEPQPVGDAESARVLLSAEGGTAYFESPELGVLVEGPTPKGR